MTQRTQNILQQVEVLQENELQEVVYGILQKSKQRNWFDYQDIWIENKQFLIINPFWTNTGKEEKKEWKKYRGCAKGIWTEDAQDFINNLRKDERTY